MHSKIHLLTIQYIWNKLLRNQFLVYDFKKLYHCLIAVCMLYNTDMFLNATNV